ncbi:MAG: arylsulfatase [Sarcina sp.]
MKPNIVLIMVDQMRGDCLGVNGNKNIETPTLDMFAKKGVNFEKAYSAVPSCIAARAGVLTGMKQKNHKRVGYQDGIPWDYEHTIASEFSNAGYHTQCIGKMHVYPERDLCGFHNIMLHDGYLGYTRDKNKVSDEINDDYLKWFRNKKGHNVDLIDSGLECNSWVSRTWPYEEEVHPTNWVVNESIDFLRRRDKRKPFFLKMSFVRPHSPLDPPEFYYNQYINEEIDDPYIGAWCDKSDEEKNGLNINCIKGNVNKKAIKRARSAYYGLITHIDHQLNRFLMSLEENNQINNTIILFTSDHGDMLGDHNLYRKAVPYEGSVRVPFIISDFGNILDIRKKEKKDLLIELRDIMPTLLDIAGIKIPKCVDGRSIIKKLKDNVSWREYIHGEHSFGYDSNHYITDGKRKYIWYSQTGIEQFFDLEKDSKEIYNLINNIEYKNEINLFRKRLINELKDREEGYSNGQELIVGKNPVAILKK